MLKPVFGVIRALLPVLYCGGLLYYFLDLSGSVEEAKRDGLGPTLLGLSIVGLLFSIPLIVRVIRLFRGPRSPGPGRRGGPDVPTHDSESGIDADAVVARYMARRAAETTPGAPAAPSAYKGGGPAKRASFGRRVR